MAIKTIDLGPVSSYAIAVQHGYTGTEEQWYELIHDVTSNAAAAQNSASGAAQSAQSALATLGQVVTAGETAVQAIQTEETTQAAALAEAGAAQIADIVAAKTTAVNTVVAQQGASVQAVYDKGVEQIAAVGAAGTAQIAAVDAAGAEVIESIPDDYQALVQQTNNMQLTKLDPVGTYTKLELTKLDGQWNFDTGSADAHTSRKYVRYEIPSGTKILGIRGYQANADNAAYGFYNGTTLIYSSLLPNGSDMASATPIGVPSGATVLYVNVGTGDIRGVWSFAGIELDQTVRMSNVGINNLTNMIAVLPETAETPTKADFDSAKNGLVYLIGFVPSVDEFTNSILHMPVRSSGVLVTYSRSATYDMGKSQTYYATTGAAFVRTMMGGTWRAWQQLCPSVYNVGASRSFKTLTDLLSRIQYDTEEKVIYMDEGVYDVFTEYTTYFDGTPGKERPDDNTPVDGYFNYCLFLPQNTKLIGLGNVVLEWLPTASEITVPESTTWSVLNLWYGNNLVENIQIHCKNCRYGIHDDSHNTYTGFKNRFVNVTINQEANDSGLGFGSVTGFGFEDRSTYEFENCTFTAPANVSGLYGHDGEFGGAVIIVRGCVINCGNSANKTAVRYQTIREDDSNPNRVFMSGCYINGGINLDQRRETSGQMFDVTLLHCGNPEQTVEVEDNPYPIKVYQ